MPRRTTGRGWRPDRVGRGHSAGSKRGAEEGGAATGGAGTAVAGAGSGAAGTPGTQGKGQVTGFNLSTETVTVLPFLKI